MGGGGGGVAVTANFVFKYLFFNTSLFSKSTKFRKFERRAENCV